MNKLPTLFHKNAKGKISTWEVWSHDNIVYTRWGLLNGKQQESRYQVEIKNEGRCNETSLEEQAHLEATSLWNHKLERKYFQTIEEAENQIIFLPMLAKSFDNRKKFLTKKDYNVDVQPKLDGCRCLAYIDDNGDCKLISRSGKEYILSHISDELKTLAKNHVLDGELYIHNTPLQQLNSLIRPTKNIKKESKNVEYHVYDIIDKENSSLQWEHRKVLLDEVFSQNNFNKIFKVGLQKAENEDQVYEIQLDYVARGYEGAIVRLGHGEYKFAYRSSELLKVKSFIDQEFEIVNFTNGIGKFENCIIYKCKTDEGKTFDVVPRGTFEERKVWLEDGKNHIGQMLTVKFFNWTNDNIPQFPVGVCVRLKEDM